MKRKRRWKAVPLPEKVIIAIYIVENPELTLKQIAYNLRHTYSVVWNVRKELVDVSVNMSLKPEVIFYLSHSAQYHPTSDKK